MKFHPENNHLLVDSINIPTYSELSTETVVPSPYILGKVIDQDDAIEKDWTDLNVCFLQPLAIRLTIRSEDGKIRNRYLVPVSHVVAKVVL